MFKKWSLRIALALILIIVVMVVTAPSQIMENQLESNVHGLQITSNEGGFWSGELSQVHFQNQSIDSISWDISVPSLLTASVGVDLNIQDPLFTGSLFVRQSATGLTSISEITGTQVVSALSQLSPLIRFASPTGELRWNGVTIAFDDERFDEARGSIKWNNAALLVNNQSVVLGQLVASFDVDNNDLLITLNSDDKFDLQASIIVSRDEQYKIVASIKDDIPNNIYNALKFMSRSDGNGRLVLNTSGRW